MNLGGHFDEIFARASKSKKKVSRPRVKMETFQGTIASVLILRTCIYICKQ